MIEQNERNGTFFPTLRLSRIFDIPQNIKKIKIESNSFPLYFVCFVCLFFSFSVQVLYTRCREMCFSLVCAWLREVAMNIYPVCWVFSELWRLANI